LACTGLKLSARVAPACVYALSLSCVLPLCVCARVSQLKAEHDARVAKVSQVAARRLGQQGLARGFGVWLSGHQAERRQKRQLLTAGQRLMRPAIAHCLGHWRALWRDAEQFKQQKQQQMGVNELRGELSELRKQMAAQARQVERDIEAAQAEHASELEAVKEEAAKELREAERAARLAEQGSSEEAKTALEAQQRQMEDALEAEREKRVQHLSSLAARRLGQQGLARGWEAWAAYHAHGRRQQRQLAAASARLQRPVLTAAFGHWLSDWQHDAKERARRQMAKDQDELRRVQSELDKVRRAAEENLEAQAEVAALELTQQRQSAEAALAAAERAAAEAHQKELEAQVEAEKEKRIAHLSQMAARRLGQQGVANGFAVWQELYLTKAAQKRMLAGAGARLMRPQLLATFGHWRADWQAELQAKLKQDAFKSKAQLEKELAELRKSMDAQLRQKDQEMAKKIGDHVTELEAEKVRAARELRAAQRELEGLRGATAEEARAAAEAYEKDMAEKLEAEKEKRIAHLQQQAQRRMGNRDLFAGWSVWHEQWEEAAKQKRQLTAAGARLMRPQLVKSFGHWLKDWRETEHEAVAARARLLQSDQSKKEAGLQAELDDARRQLKHALDASSSQKHALTTQLAEEAAAAEVAYGAQLTEQLEAEREKRINHLSTMAAKRFGQRELASGWAVWHEQWAEASAQKRMLAAAGARLQRPALSAALTHWLKDWQYESREKAKAQLLGAAGTERLKLEEELRNVRAAMAQALEAAAKDRAALKAQMEGDFATAEVLYKQQQEEALEAEKEKRIAHLQQQAQRRMANRDLFAGWSVWHEQWEEVSKQKRMLAAAGARLSRPALTSAFSAWLGDWRVEQLEQQKKEEAKAKRALMSAADKEKEDLQAQLAALREEMSKKLVSLQVELDDAKADAAVDEKVWRQAVQDQARSKEDEARAKAEAHQKEMQEKLEMEHEKRVQHLQTMAARRMGQQGLVNCWTTWLELFEEISKQKRQLAAAGARLMRPQLVAAFAGWRSDWAEAEKEKEREQQRLLRAANESVEAKLQREMERMAAEMQALREAAEADRAALKAQMEGDFAAAEVRYKQQQEEALEAEREKRVAHLQKMAARRLGSQGLVHGWETWHGLWSEIAKQKRMLAAAGARLQRPQLSAAMTHWLKDWRAEQAAAAKAALVAQAGSDRAAMQAELEKLRAEHAASLEASEAARLAEKAQAESERAEAEAAYEKQQAELLEAEQEKRIAHLQQQAARRMGNRDLSMGWSVWHEQWEEVSKQKRQLAAAGARLMRPQLVASFGHWRADWRAEEAEKLLAKQKHALAEQRKKEGSLAEQLAALKVELEEARVLLEAKEVEKVEAARGVEAAYQKQLEEQAEAEKEKRVAMLQAQAQRRMANRDLFAGWSVWHEQWEEAARQKRMLAAAGARLTRPALVAAVNWWKVDWGEAQTEKRAQEAEKAKAVLLAAQDTMAAHHRGELDKLRGEMMAMLDSKEAEKAAVLDELASARSAKEEEAKQAALKKEEEHDKRVQHLGQMAIKRIGQLGLARGWGMWLEEYMEATKQKRMLAAAGARLMMPALSAAFGHWRTDWTAAEHEKVLAGQRLLQSKQAEREQELLEEMGDLKDQLRAALAAVEEQAKKAADSVLQATEYAEAQYQKELEAQADAEKEKRVAMLQAQAQRRMANRDLFAGWSVWHEQWAEAARQKRMLAAAGARLSRPQLVAAVSAWKVDWQAAQAEKEAKRREEMVAAHAAAAAAHGDELTRLRAEHAAALETAANDRAALKAQMDGDFATAQAMYQKQQEEALEAEKENRIAHLQAQAARRMGNADLSNGWSVWHAQWEEAAATKRMLAAAGARLQRPQLTAAFAGWRSDWAEAEKAKAKELQQKQLMAKAQREAQLQAEVEELKKQLQAALEHSADEKAQLAKDAAAAAAAAEEEYDRRKEEALEVEKEKRIAHLQQQAQRRMANRDLFAGWSAWHEQWEEVSKQKRMLAAAGARLSRPQLAAAMTYWVKDWRVTEAEKARLAAEVEKAAIAKEKAQDRASLLAELEQLKKDMALALEDAAAEKDELVAQLQNDARSQQEEAAKQAALALEQEQEKRIAHLQQQAARRMGNRDLSMGWSVWHELWEEVSKQKRMLAAAGARLSRPQLTAAFSGWRSDWAEAGKERREEGRRLLQNEHARQFTELQAKLLTTQQELAEAREGATAEALRLQQQMAGDLATAEAAYQKQQEQALEVEKEKRIAHLQQQAQRRMANRDLFAGWSVWHEQWEEVSKQKRMLAAAGARLQRPQLVAAMTHWVTDWRVAEKARLEAEAAESKAKLLAAQVSEREQMQAEIASLKAELNAALEGAVSEKLALETRAAADAAMAEAAYQKQQEETLEAEKEKRIAHLQQQAQRRMANTDLFAGWSTWHEQWAEQAAQKRMLAAAGARLSRPQLAAALAHWLKDWKAEEAERKRKEAEEAKRALMGTQAAERKAAEAKISDLEKALAVALQKAEADRAAFKAQMEGDFAAAEAAYKKQQEEALEAEKEKRVAHLQAQAARRMGQADLLAGWSVWHEQWEEVSKQKRMLAAAGARLSRPQLAAAMTHWLKDWQVEEAEKARQQAAKARHALMSEAASERAQLQAEVEVLQAQLKGAMEGSAAERASLQQQMAGDLASAEDAYQRQMKEKLDAEHEKRVAHLQQMAARRMGQLGLSHAWNVWQELYLTKAAQKRMLAGAGARLQRPALVATFAHWRTDWHTAMLEEQKRDKERAKAALVKEAAETRGAMQAEVAQLKQQLAETIAAAEREKAELLAQMAGDTQAAEKEYQRQLDEKLEVEKEKRIAHLQQQASRRMGQQDLFYGWSTWHEQWEEVSKQKRMLAAAGARLSRPQLAACFSGWLADWREAEMARLEAEAAAAKKKLVSEASSERAQLQAEVVALQAQLKEALSASVAEKAKLQSDMAGDFAAAEAAYQKQMDEKLEAEKEKRIAHLQQQASRRMGQQDLFYGWSTWHEQWTEVSKQKRMLAAAGARLQRPALSAALTYWLKDWQADRAEHERQEEAKTKAALVAKAGSEREALQTEVASLKAALAQALEAASSEAQQLQARAVKDKADAEAEYIRIMEERLENEKEARIAHLQAQAQRRMANTDLFYGWSTWHEQWAEEAAQKRMLAAAGARLARPQLTAAFSHWLSDWQFAEKIRLKKQAEREKREAIKSLTTQAGTEREHLEAQLKEVQQQLKEALQKAAADRAALEAQMKGDFAAAEAAYKKQKEEALEVEKEKRVAHLQAQAARRMGQADLVNAWDSWHEMWSEVAKQKRMLAAAGARLQRPQLTAAFSHWMTDWRVETREHEREEAAKAKAALVSSAKTERQALLAEVEELRAKLKEALDVGAAESGSLRKQMAEDAASAEAAYQKEMEEKLEAEKEARIAHLQAQAARRMGQADLANGWSVWHEQWAEVAAQKRMLAAAGARLARPQLAAALAHWLQDWRAAEAEKARKEADEAKRALMLEAGTERERLVAQLTQVQKQLAELRETAAADRAALEAQMKGDFAAAEARYQQQQAEALEAEKEKRVAHLQAQAARRMGQADLLAGWSVWHEQWEEVSKQKRMLAAAGARLSRPQLAAALAHWLSDWRAEEAEKARLAAEAAKKALASAAKSEREAMALELKEVKAQLAELLRSSADEKFSLEERMKADAAAAEEAHAKELATKLEAEKEARIAHLQQQAQRRMANTDLFYGWSTWHEQWAEQAAQKRMLAAAGARLSRPALAAALSHWLQDWRAEEVQRKLAAEAQRKRELMAEARRKSAAAEGGAAEAQKALEQARREAETMRATFEKQLAGLHKELAAARETNSAQGATMDAKMKKALESADEAYERKLAEQAAAEKEARVQQLGQMAIRRMVQADLANGWSVWHEQWAEVAAQKRMLAAAGARLARPQLAAALAHWLQDWRAAEAEKARKEAEAAKAALMAQAGSQRDAMQAQLDALQAQLVAAGAAAGKQTASLEADAASRLEAAEAAYQKQMEEKLEAEREKRIAHLQQMAARRMGQMDVANGFGTWQDQWAEVARQKRMLAAAGARLQRPQLMASFAHWRTDWTAEEKERERKEAAAAKQALLASSGTEKQKLEAELAEVRAQLAAVMVEKEREAAALQKGAEDAAATVEALYHKEMAEKLEAEREKRIAHLQAQAQRRMMNADLFAGWSIWHEQWAEQAAQKRMLAAAGARLARPQLAAALAHWLQDWRAEETQRKEAEVEAAKRAMVEAASGDRASLQKQLIEVQAQLKLELEKSAQQRTELEAALSNQALTAEQMYQKQFAELEEQEKEKRVAHLQKMAVRRMVQQDLVRAWEVWSEQWSEHATNRRMLAAAGARLMKPQLTAAFAHWRVDWAAEEKEKLLEQQRQEKAAFMEISDAARVHLDEELRKARNETSKLSLERVAIADERQQFKTKYERLQEDKRAAAAEMAALQKILEDEKKVIAEQELKPRLEHLKTMKKIERERKAETTEVEGRLQELLAQQRESFEEERERIAAERGEFTAGLSAQQKAFDEQAQALRTERGEVQQQLETLKGDLELKADEQKHLEAQTEKLKAKLEERKDWRPPPPPKPPPEERKVPVGKSGLLKNFTVDTSEGAPSVGEQLRGALAKNAGRVIDLFREWDTDGDGKVSKKEFRRAMPMLGFDVPVADIDKLFDANDPDGSGEMDFKELKQMLKSRTGATPSEVKAQSAMAAVKAANTFKRAATGGDKKAAAGTPATGAAAAQRALSGLKKKA